MSLEAKVPEEVVVAIDGHARTVRERIVCATCDVPVFNLLAVSPPYTTVPVAGSVTLVQLYLSHDQASRASAESSLRAAYGTALPAYADLPVYDMMAKVCAMPCHAMTLNLPSIPPSPVGFALMAVVDDGCG